MMAPLRRRRRLLPWYGRLSLVVLALLWLGVFAVAFVLDPYRDGRVWMEETHRQLGLPACTFKYLTGYPCASCGMSTSFALMVRGDVWNAVQANVVGALLALFGMIFIPWALYSAARGRLLWIRSLERVIITLTLGFVIILFLRWGIVLVILYVTG